MWRAFAATGADLLWRMPANRVLEVDRALPDGSWLSRMYAAGDWPARRNPVRVRVVAYDLDDPGRPDAGPYRLITTLLDWERHPARELAALYAQRWEEETALDELKAHQRGAGVVLASKTPDGIRQQVWAHLLVHYALRAVMHAAALEEDLDPDRLSFIRSLRVVRRQLIARPAFSP